MMDLSIFSTICHKLSTYYPSSSVCTGLPEAECTWQLIRHVVTHSHPVSARNEHSIKTRPPATNPSFKIVTKTQHDDDCFISHSSTSHLTYQSFIHTNTYNTIHSLEIYEMTIRICLSSHIASNVLVLLTLFNSHQ